MRRARTRCVLGELALITACSASVSPSQERELALELAVVFDSRAPLVEDVAVAHLWKPPALQREAPMGGDRGGVRVESSPWH